MEKITIRIGSSLLFLTMGLVGLAYSVDKNTKRNQGVLKEAMGNMKNETITLGAGCFWCVEAVFSEMNGVISATSGYMGGSVKNPAYREVCNGTTGHAEVVQVIFDPSIIDLDLILEIFFSTHDPTTLNRQGADVGTQYRSAIYFHEKEQEIVAINSLEKAAARYTDNIVTEVTAASAFYVAENYHQDYFELHGEAPYCQAVIAPKMTKFREKYAPLLKN